MPLIHLKVSDQLNKDRKTLDLSWLEVLEAGIAAKKNPVTQADNILPHLVAAHKSIKTAFDLLKTGSGE